MSDSCYRAPLLNAKKYSQRISAICLCTCSIISLFGLPVNAAECLIGYYSNTEVDHLKGFASEMDC